MDNIIVSFLKGGKLNFYKFPIFCELVIIGKILWSFKEAISWALDVHMLLVLYPKKTIDPYLINPDIII